MKTSFEVDGRTIRAQSWHNLVVSDCKVDQCHETFSIWVFFDPLYTNPLVLGTNLFLQPVSRFKFYLDRWPVEQVPLVAKQMLGLHRQFVFAPESCQRLPELAMLVGNILSYLALVLPAIPTGFWDRRPQKTTGRLRRVLARSEFPQIALIKKWANPKKEFSDGSFTQRHRCSSTAKTARIESADRCLN